MGCRSDALKTRDFATDKEVAALVLAFENASIPASEFTHAAHIAVALSYLNALSPDEALQRMREKIRFFAAHHGVTNLYHETLTTFCMGLLEHVANTSDVDPSRRNTLAKADLSTLAPDQFDRRRLDQAAPGRSPLLDRADQVESSP